MPQPPPPDLVAAIRSSITDEICYAISGSRTGFLRWLSGPLFYLPANKFAHIFARFDEEVGRTGLNSGTKLLLTDFSLKMTTQGTENIPATGPLLLVANHPGTYDSVVIPSCIPRKDLKMVVSDVRVAHSLRSAIQYFVPVPLDPGAISGRMLALRSMVDHLQSGGALVIFARGEVEPDPAVAPGAYEDIANWSPSLEIMLRKVPDTWLQIIIASHMLLPQFTNSPIIKIRRSPPQQQKLAEFIQVIQQLISPKSVDASVRLSFAPPVSASELIQGEVMPTVIQLARRALEEHIRQF
jgi:hypothetical protein